MAKDKDERLNYDAPETGHTYEDRKEIYYEHLGRLDDPKYAVDNVRKLSTYALNGLTLGDKLFTTMETSVQPLDVRILDELIEKKFR